MSRKIRDQRYNYDKDILIHILLKHCTLGFRVLTFKKNTIVNKHGKIIDLFLCSQRSGSNVKSTYHLLHFFLCIRAFW